MSIDPKRFHPRQNLLLLHLKPEKMEGRFHVPDNVKVVVPIAEILECGPNVEKDVPLEQKRYRPGVHVLVHLQTVLQIDKEFGFVADDKVLALVDPKSVIETVLST